MNIDMNNENTKNEHVRKVIFTGVMAALSYVVFTFLQIKITLPGGDATSIHLGNAVCVLAAWRGLWRIRRSYRHDYRGFA